MQCSSSPTTQAALAFKANPAPPFRINNRQKKGPSMLWKSMATRWFRTAVADVALGTYVPLKGTRRAIIATLVRSKRTTRKEQQNVAPVSWSESGGLCFACMNVLVARDGT